MLASLAAYLAEDAESVMKGALYAPYHQYTLQVRSTAKAQTTPTPTPFTLLTRRPLKEDEVRYDGEISRIVDAGSQDIAQDRAEELGKAALLEDFGLPRRLLKLRAANWFTPRCISVPMDSGYGIWTGISLL